MNWYLLRAATRQEPRAIEGLREAGFEVYCPMFTRWHRVGRQARREERRIPLFPGYMFVLVGDGEFADVEAVDGVSGFVRYTNATGERSPLTTPLSVLEEVRAMEASGEHDEPDPNKPPALKIGERVLVLEGPYKGYYGEIKLLPSEKRVKVLLEAVTRGGWAWQVEVDRPHVEKAA